MPAMCFVIQSASAGTAGSWDPEWSPCAHAAATRRAAGKNERILVGSETARFEGGGDERGEIGGGARAGLLGREAGETDVNILARLRRRGGLLLPELRPTPLEAHCRVGLGGYVPQQLRHMR